MINLLIHEFRIVETAQISNLTDTITTTTSMTNAIKYAQFRIDNYTKHFETVKLLSQCLGIMRHENRHKDFFYRVKVFFELITVTHK